MIDNILKEKDKLAKEILFEMYKDDYFTDEVREQKAIKDVKWLLNFVVESNKYQDITMLENFYAWMIQLFQGLYIDSSHVFLMHDSLKTVLKRNYNNQELQSFLEEVEIDENTDFSFLLDVNPYEPYKEQYLEALLNSNRTQAYSVVKTLMDKKVTITDIYLYIFQEAMRDIGYKWLTGEINVGREHYATALTQSIMSSLYSSIFDGREKNLKFLGCAVGSELHEMGIRMVADVFEMNGWETNYLGANLPTEQIISYAIKYQPNIIGLSITMPYHISTLKETIDKIKQEEALENVKIIVGGLPFIKNESLYQKTGADGFAKDAVAAVKVANELV